MLDTILNPCYNNLTKGKEKPKTPERAPIMKISSMKTLVAYFYAQPSVPSDVADVVGEMELELAKEHEKQNAKLELYEAAYQVVMAKLGDKPMTLVELWGAVNDELPEDFTKNKLSYALTHYWADDVVVTKGKVNEYRRK